MTDIPSALVELAEAIAHELPYPDMTPQPGTTFGVVASVIDHDGVTPIPIEVTCTHNDENGVSYTFQPRGGWSGTGTAEHERET